MNADKRRYESQPGALPLNELTRQVIGCAMQVSNELGCGFLEKVYENALAHELQKANLPFAQQQPIRVMYDGVVVGEYVADLLVDKRLLIELKAVKAIDEIHIAQTINYLRALEHRIGLILNFGKPKLEIKRLVHKL